MFLSKLYTKNCLKSFTNLRTITSTKSLKVEHEEIRIPVPWGHIAGQRWGSKEHRPILALTGWKDNIGTFLPLVEEVSKHIGVVCLEWPGFGYSSHFPPGFYYNYDTMIVILHHILKHFKWNKVSFMGYSLGSGSAFVYAALYPELVDFIAGIEVLVPLPTKPTSFCKRRQQSLDSFLEWDKTIAKGEYKLYTYEEAQKEVANMTSNSIPLEYTSHYLKRELIQSDTHPDKYYFRMDPRHNVYSVTFTPEIIYEMAQHVRCPILNIKGTQFPYLEGETMYKNVCEILKKNNVPLQIESIEGAHHIHLTNTKECASIIKQFIQKYDNEKRFMHTPN